jgi:hypothetical protein
MELALWLILAALVAGLSFICFNLNIIYKQLDHMIAQNPSMKYNLKYQEFVLELFARIDKETEKSNDNMETL